MKGLTIAVAWAISVTSATALAHPDHRDDDAPPPVPGIEPAPPTPTIEPEATPTDAQLLAMANAAAETIVIKDDAPAESASSIHLDLEHLMRRPHAQMSDVLRQVPGLAVSQHAGGGKADQYFIRGFDADHGTDIAVFADGVPVNLVSHGHGQGYADTHWLIPETIGSVDVHKGPYAARYGDFYTAGALELRTRDSLDDDATVWISGGSSLHGGFDRRLVAMASPRLGDGDGDKTLLAAEIGQQDGPFVTPQGFQRGIAMGKWKTRLGKGQLSLEANGYTARWNQSGQLPESLVASGALDRFGAVDPSEGGASARGSGKLGYERPIGDAGTLRVASYAVRSDLDLFSNFTLWARDQEHGDQIEQTDGRMLYGLDASYQHAVRDLALVTTGVQVRADDVETSLWHTEQRRRLAIDNHHTSAIRDVAAYAEANVMPTRWLHVFPGVRVDRFSWDVTNLAPPMPLGGLAAAPPNASVARAIASPKLSVEIHASEQVSLFANSGGGFHSNDARAAVETRGAGALARAWGGEIGARVKPSPGTRVAMDAWYLHLSSEQVWNGDEGGTAASAPTQRIGLDLEGSTDVTPWLALDANVTFAHASFVANQSNGGAVALAPRWMGSGGVTAKRGQHSIALRGRGIADRAGNEDSTLVAPGYLLFDLVAGTQYRGWGANLTIVNLANSAWREAQFAESSRVTPTADIVEQMHFTPGVPLTAIAQLSRTW